MKHLTKLEVRNLLSVARKHSERDWAMILVAYLHGLRASEVCGRSGVTRPVKGKERTLYPLRGVDIRDGEIVVQRLKGSRKTTQPLVSSDDPLFNEKIVLEKMASETQGILFPISRVQFWRIFQKYGALAGLKKSLSHPHICKHSIASHAIVNTPINNVQQHLGHESLSSTGAYLQVDDQTASKAVAAAVGL